MHTVDIFCRKYENLFINDSLNKRTTHYTWGDPRSKSGAIGAQILKSSKGCLGSLLRILCQYP